MKATKKILFREQSREYSLFRVETWFKVTSQEFPKILGAQLTEVCAIYRGKDLVDVYYDPTGFKRIMEAYVKNVQSSKGKKEALDNIKNFLSNFKELKPYFTGQKYISNAEELRWFQEKYAVIWAYISMVYIIPSLPVDEELKKYAHEARIKTQEYNEAPEKVFSRFIEANFPELKDGARFILPEEIWNDEVKSKDIHRKIEARKKGYLFYKNEIFTGDLASHLERLGIVLEEKESVISGKAEVTEHEIKGQTANKGQVKGMVKIVASTKDLPKVNMGDILVAAMTMPKYLPAMKKAAAFVTDEGGITCHAAIISREMKKPCIIGTKIATQVLKDGDLVEVDAERGIVKILKRARRIKTQ